MKGSKTERANHYEDIINKKSSSSKMDSLTKDMSKVSVKSKSKRK